MLENDFVFEDPTIQDFARALFSPAISSSTIARFSRTYGAQRIGRQLTELSNAEEPLPLSIIDHISDSAAFGGTKELELSSQAFYNISGHCPSIPSAKIKGKAYFKYTIKESHFTANIGINSTLHHVSGSELCGTLSICAAPLNAIEGSSVLFRVPLLQTTNLACGEFNIIILSFCRAPETEAIFHRVYTLEFRNRRWSLDNHVVASSGASSGTVSHKSRIIQACEEL